MSTRFAFPCLVIAPTLPSLSTPISLTITLALCTHDALTYLSFEAFCIYHNVNCDGQFNNQFHTRQKHREKHNKVGASNSRHCNWSQKEMDIIDNSTNNSTHNGRKIGSGKKNKGPSCQHNTNWGHEEVMALINCKHKE